MESAFSEEDKNRYKIDEEIYLNENRYDTPKESFKFIGKNIARFVENKEECKITLLDVGCATGELIYYLRTLFPGFNYTGFDISEKMLKHASFKMSEVNFYQRTILDLAEEKSDAQYDFVIMSGVLSIFDDTERVLENLIPLVKKGGNLLVYGFFNDLPVDVIMRYKSSDDSEWKSGWNIISTKYCEKIIRNICLANIEWVDFNIGFSLERPKDDFMRVWTMATEGSPYQHINGACQLLNMKLMIVSIT